MLIQVFPKDVMKELEHKKKRKKKNLNKFSGQLNITEHYAVYLKLTQQCKSTRLQQN